jgi:hypothetical protein
VFFNYVRDFTANLQSVTLAPVSAQRSAPDTITFTPPGGLQAFTQITVPVESLPGNPANGATVALAIDGGPHRTWFSERQSLTADGPLTFTFPVPAEVKPPATGSLRLCAYDGNGREVKNAAAFPNDAAKNLGLAFDLDQTRALSRLVIQWHRAAPR